MSRQTLEASLGAAAMLFVSALPAYPHATLEVGQAPIKASYKGVVRVGHGCEGSPTLKVRVRIPEGVIAVKPVPKAGWTLETVRGNYAKPAEYHGQQMTEGVREIVWTGKLLDEHFDEFGFRGFLSASLEPGTTLYFPVVQECEKGAHRWIEIPAAGKSSHDLKEPAPGVKLLPAGTGSH
ncbi:MAG: DUF1775 domain-containing protein [Burkholderiales bacterium]|jgi:uncharacterized protein YcnI|nr:DUF1775 domain-containing protein [Burkholderiales bacterium]